MKYEVIAKNVTTGDKTVEVYNTKEEMVKEFNKKNDLLRSFPTAYGMKRVETDFQRIVYFKVNY